MIVVIYVVFGMSVLPPITTRPDKLFPYTTPFRSGVRPRAKRLHGVPRDARRAPSCCVAATVESGRKKAGVVPRPVVRRRNPGRTPPPPCERREANGDGDRKSTRLNSSH